MVPNTHVDGFVARKKHHHTAIAAAHAALFESRKTYRLSMSERAEAYDEHDRMHAVVMAAANAAEATVVSGRRTSPGAVFLFRSTVSGSQVVRYDALTATITATATSVRIVRGVMMA
jgi:hypothetical protein